MDTTRTIDVWGENGLIGTIDRADSVRRAEVVLRLDDGRELNVPAEHLTPRDDGSYYLAVPIEQLEQESIGEQTIQGKISDVMPTIIPLAIEELEISRKIVETGRVRISKKVSEHEELIEEPVIHEHVEITRVPVGSVIEGPVEVRYEGETMIIPVVREVLVVEKRLVLEEEIHVTRRRIEEVDRQTITLREESVVATRMESGTDNAEN